MNKIDRGVGLSNGPLTGGGGYGGLPGGAMGELSPPTTHRGSKIDGRDSVLIVFQ
jgi:hypothetical protein